MKLITKIIGATFVASLAFGTLSLTPIWTPNALAQVQGAKTIVDQAKSQGLVGEQLDGYIGFIRSDVSSKVRAAVNEINITRRSIYTKKAREKKVAVSDVAGLMGEKLIARAKSGEMVKIGDGQWHPAG